MSQNKENFFEKKREKILNEFIELDEKDYIPAEEYFLMIDSYTYTMTPKEFVQSTKDFPKEWKEYLNDPRPIEKRPILL